MLPPAFNVSFLPFLTPYKMRFGLLCNASASAWAAAMMLGSGNTFGSNSSVLPGSRFPLDYFARIGIASCYS